MRTFAEKVPFPTRSLETCFEIMNSPDDEQKLSIYLERRNLKRDSCLGVGTQGSVFLCQIISQTSANGEQEEVAVKIHQHEIAYRRELSVYLRLKELGVFEVNGLMVPVLLHHDDDCLAIEMTIVSPPFCLDFGGAYLDRRPDYSPEVWADWRKMKEADFQENWPRVQSVLAHFESMGVFIADLNPGNVKFQ